MHFTHEDISTFVFYSSMVMITNGILNFIILLFFKTAPYGKFSTSKGWGMLLPAKFCWLFMESPNLWITAVIYYIHRYGVVTSQSSSLLSKDSFSPSSSFLPNHLFLCLFLLHYINRSLIFPFLISPNSNPMPISIAFFSFAYCCWNSLTQASSLLLLSSYPSSYICSFRCLLGCGIFLLGLYINISSDSLLIRLRKKKKTETAVEDSKQESKTRKDENINDESDKEKDDHKKKYIIPVGGIFNYVSSANYRKYLLFLLVLF
jgi:hypothetical protein